MLHLIVHDTLLRVLLKFHPQVSLQAVEFCLTFVIALLSSLIADEVAVLHLQPDLKHAQFPHALPLMLAFVIPDYLGMLNSNAFPRTGLNVAVSADIFVLQMPAQHVFQ